MSRALDTTFATHAFTDLNVAGLGPRPVALRLVRDTTCSLDVLREVRGPDSLRTELAGVDVADSSVNDRAPAA
ncbi:MAG TPA: hypothetical protein VF761_14080 [Gemmatimonadaceae bacterium]